MGGLPGWVRAPVLGMLLTFLVAPAADAGFRGKDGNIAFTSCNAFASDCEGGQMYVTAAGGPDVRPLIAAGSQADGWGLDWHPDGRRVAVTRLWWSLKVGSLDGGTWQEIGAGTTQNFAESARWSPDGRRIVVDGGFEPHGLWLMDPDGGNPKLLLEGDYRHPTWSPDGRRLAFMGPSDYGDSTNGSDIYTIGVDGSYFDNATNDPGFERSPSWSPDGKRLAYAKDGDIWTMQPSGFDRRRVTTTASKDERDPDWSPSGSRIVYSAGSDIWVIDADGTDARNVTNNPSTHDYLPDWQTLETSVLPGPGTPVAGLLDVRPVAVGAAAYVRGTTIQARAAIRNETSSPIVMQRGVITARPPGSSRRGGPVYYDFTGGTPTETVAARSTRVINGTFALPANAPVGRYDVYATYRDNNGEWHDGPPTYIEVSAPALPAPPAPPAAPQAPAVTPPLVAQPGAVRPTVRLRSLRGRLRTFMQRGMKVPVRCSKRCAVRARMTLGRSTVASARATRSRKGAVTLSLKASKQGRRLLSKRRRATLVLRWTVAGASGDTRAYMRKVVLR